MLARSPPSASCGCSSSQRRTSAGDVPPAPTPSFPRPLARSYTLPPTFRGARRERERELFTHAWSRPLSLSLSVLYNTRGEKRWRRCIYVRRGMVVCVWFTGSLRIIDVRSKYIRLCDRRMGAFGCSRCSGYCAAWKRRSLLMWDHHCALCSFWGMRGIYDELSI